jgi:predicted nucleotidyltransferase
MKHLTVKASIVLILGGGLVLSGLLGVFPGAHEEIHTLVVAERNDPVGPTALIPPQMARETSCAAANNGSCSGGFTQVITTPTGVAGGSVAWGDYDNDGDLDILLAGSTGSVYETEVWRNDGGDTFTLASTDPTGVHEGGAVWGDYDDDGDLDILLSGNTGVTIVTEVWENDGGTFSLASSDPTNLRQGSVAWGDCDNDGDLDILLAGNSVSSGGVTEVWRNEGGGTFTPTITSLTGVIESSVAWGDYDDDGLLDILFTGYNSTTTSRVTEVWRSSGACVYTQASTAPTGIWRGDATWGDYDNDGDLDILLTGSTGTDYVTEVWRNDGSDIFTQASTDPTGVNSSSAAWGDYDDDGDLDFLLAGHTGSIPIAEVWRNDGGDTFTQASTDPSGVSSAGVAWGDYDDDGDLDILLTGITGSTRVTEVWRNEACRCSGAIFTQASTAPTGLDYGSVDWGDYGDDGDLDILLAGYTGSTRVTEIWVNNSYAGTFIKSLTVITGTSDGDVSWGDYDHDGDEDILLSGWSNGGRVTQVWRNDMGAFTLANSDPTAVNHSSVDWGDYDDDGDLDILLAGYTGSARVTQVWQKNGSLYTLASVAPTGVEYGSVEWGDYDHDGDLDILLSGYTGSTRVTEVWQNDGGVFTSASTAPTGVRRGAAAWGDYDDDGDLDILLSGDSSGGRVTEVWQNNAGVFTSASSAPTGLDYASVAWGDYDDDGDLDILLSGRADGPNYVTEIWENDGGTFTLARGDLTGAYLGDVAWGDYDNDGDLDILLTGATGTGRVTEVWRSECYEAYIPLILRNY